LGKREGDEKNNFSLPEGFKLENLEKEDKTLKIEKPS